MLKLTLNGEPRELPSEVETVLDLLRHLGMDKTPAAVEVNKQLIPKRRHPEARLQEGDAVEVVTLVGGG